MSKKSMYSESLLICSNAFQRWILKMDQYLYKSLYPMKHLIVPLLMKRIIAVRLHHLDMLQFREQMNHLWRNMCSQQVSTMLRVKSPTNDTLWFLSICSIRLLIHFRFFSMNNKEMQDAPLP